MTGYSHIDKPWEKYFDLSKKSSIDVNKTIYENFFMTATSNIDELAIIDYLSGVKITYKELLDQIDLFAQALSKIGIGENKKVGMLGFNALIDPIVLLGANKVGAAVMFLAPEDGSKDLAKFVQHLDAVVMEGFTAEMEPLINPDNKPIVVWGDCKCKLRDNCLAYDTFIEQGSEVKTGVSKFSLDQPALIIFSSGSTGAPKPIVHSNYTVNAAVEKMGLSDYPLDSTNLLVKCVPSHIGLGSITTMLVGLLIGVPYIQMKGFPYFYEGLKKEIASLISNYRDWLEANKLNKEYGLLIFAAPMFATALFMMSPMIKDMSFIRGMLLGGAKMLAPDIEKMNCTFEKLGLSVPLCNGYGQNELAGAAALNTVNHNKNGSAGYPVHNTNVRIVDRDTFKDVKLGVEGQILEQSNSQHLCYLGMPEKTAESFITLPDGTVWYNTMDLGYMDKDGFLYITGRTNRVIIKSDHKISLESVEEKIGLLDFVVEVAVVPLDEEGNTICYACVNNDISEEALLDLLQQEFVGLSIFEMPVKASIVEGLPRLDSGKIDFTYLASLN